MKNYTITVNGNVYEVTVEEGFTGKASAPAAFFFYFFFNHRFS